MADCLTQCSTQQLKSRVLWLYIASNSPSMTKILLLLFVLSGLLTALLLTHVPKLAVFVVPVSSRWLISGDKFNQFETSVILRVRQKLPINPGKLFFCYLMNFGSLTLSCCAEIGRYHIEEKKPKLLSAVLRFCLLVSPSEMRMPVW